tara:strand:+ start:207 stop:995 length:789 start_codon:yes stop_codon:yes gene_type:complete
MPQKDRMNVFITGGTTGIGFSLAKLYQSKGHVVGVCGRDLNKLSDESMDSYTVDVTDEKQIKNAVQKFCEKNGPLNIMIANAGIAMGPKDGKVNFSLARDVININVLGVINTFDAAMECFPQSGGHLVGISSVAALVGLPGTGPYSASKAAVLRLCESYGLDWKKIGVDVTAICPGFINTPLTKKNDHSMPFLMSSDVAANKMYDAIERKAPLFIFPWQMNLLMRFAEKVPRWFYRLIVMKGMSLAMPKSKEGPKAPEISKR